MKPPDATYLLDSYRFLWQDEQVDILVDRLHEERGGLTCEMTIASAAMPLPGLVREGRFNLSAPTTRSQWVRALADRMEEVDWYAAMEQVCSLSVKRWRRGEPLVDLARIDVPAEAPFLIPPFVIDGGATVLFADGGSGKSLFALALGLCVATGLVAVEGIYPLRQGPIIYLDWEWDAESHAERLKALCEGLDIDPPLDRIFYRHELSSVLESAPAVRRLVAESGAVMVIVDSLGMARGGEPESADLTIKTFAAFRTFGVPVLAIDHVAKHATDRSQSFGSVYTKNASRLMWRLDSVAEEGSSETAMALVNTKWNRKHQRSRGFVMRTESDEHDRLISVRFDSKDLRDIPTLTKVLPLRTQIEGIIRANQGHPMTAKEIAFVMTGVTENTARTTLNRYPETFVRVGSSWALLANSLITGGL